MKLIEAKVAIIFLPHLILKNYKSLIRSLRCLKNLHNSELFRSARLNVKILESDGIGGYFVQPLDFRTDEQKILAIRLSFRIITIRR